MNEIFLYLTVYLLIIVARGAQPELADMSVQWVGLKPGTVVQVVTLGGVVSTLPHTT